MEIKDRAGYFMINSKGYNAFVPAKLPPIPAVDIDPEMYKLLSSADRKLGRLDGVTQVLPNPELFVAMYVRKEALLSSQIEGTQASLVDILDADIIASEEKKNDIAEVVNYVNAMRFGLQRLESFPLSLRLIRDIHKILLHGTRGASRNPGEFRTSQNWIGPAGSSINNATFVPPTVPDMNEALGDLENFMHKQDEIPALIKIAIIHAQFETIHPFLDGNGRMGRLLITFWLCHENVLCEPLLYLSHYFKQNRSEYYDRLMDVRRKGDWEQWVKFFLKGVASVSDEAIDTAKVIIKLKEKCSNLLYECDKNNSHMQKLLLMLFENPIIGRRDIEQELSVSNPTAGSLIAALEDVNILQDITPEKSRNKKYIFEEYIAVLEKGTELYKELT